MDSPARPFTLKSWAGDPYAKADSRIKHADEFWIECLIKLADSDKDVAAVTFLKPAEVQ